MKEDTSYDGYDWLVAPVLGQAVTGFPLPGHRVLDYTKNVVVWSDSPTLLVGRVGDVELPIFLIIGVECKA